MQTSRGKVRERAAAAWVLLFNSSSLCSYHYLEPVVIPDFTILFVCFGEKMLTESYRNRREINSCLMYFYITVLYLNTPKGECFILHTKDISIIY